MSYIYHKKPDGTINRIAVTDEDKQQKLRALNLDKQLFEQRGKEYGTIYKSSDELPDEDRVKLGIITEEELKEKKKQAAAGSCCRP